MANRNESESVKVSLKIGELQEELIALFQIEEFPAILLKSAPGVGKTESVRYAASKCIHTDGKPYDFIVLHPVGRDQSHVGGYPTIINGKAVHVSYGDLETLSTATRPVVCLVDDFGQCAQSTQAAYQQLIQERSFNGVHVSPFVKFVLATNRREDRAGVAGVLTTITGRTIQIDVEPDVERLVKFFAENYPDVPEIGAFLIKRPGFITDPVHSEDARRGALVGSPSPRTIEYAAKIRRAKRSYQHELVLIAGACGLEFATEFCGFAKIWQSLVPLRKILADPLTAPVSTKPNELYAECGSLVHHADRSNLKQIAAYINRLPREFQAYFYKLIEVQKPALTETTEFIDYATNNSF